MTRPNYLGKDEMYPAEEREKILKKMDAAIHVFYSLAIDTGNHAFIEFTGLMREYHKMCEAMHAAGIDFTQANTHSGIALQMPVYSADYLAEKLNCIYGRALAEQKEHRNAFVHKLFEGMFTLRPVAKKEARRDADKR